MFELTYNVRILKGTSEEDAERSVVFELTGSVRRLEQHVQGAVG
jgi:hypothetical protein